MSVIDKTIWLIESHLGAPLDLDTMAEHAGVSRSHLSRVFSFATGISLSGYLRGRRLSMAARALAAGAPDILEVALDVGYGSHEAFTRAFRDQFGVTPEQVRRQRSVQTLTLVEPLDMTTDTDFSLADPTIETRPPMRVAGLLEHHDMSDGNAFPAHWQRFGPFIGNVPGAIPGPAYGVCTAMEGEICSYAAAMEITERAELPPEFTVIEIPGGRWARFPHTSHISMIRSTVSAIFTRWMPEAHEQQAEDISFVEYYGADFDPRRGTGTVEIWIRLVD
ncbi:AraC family transcriptional regulator [Devosia sp.]|uniref:AraC family transcriptional regulator n=1 Tax=Devosia sp. TaxID=1871048 RepID=UPI003A92E301